MKVSISNLPRPRPANRADLDALPAPQREAFLALLAGTLWRLQEDPDNQRYLAVQDPSTIARYGFTAEDFPTAPVPSIPEWAPAVEPIPREVTRRQAMLALYFLHGITEEAIWTAIDAIEDPALKTQATIEFKNASGILYDSPLIALLGPLLGLDQAQIDALFRDAATR